VLNYQSMKSGHPTRRQGRTGKAAAVILMLALWWAMLALNLSPKLHQVLHQDAKSSTHQCAVTQLSGGLVLAGPGSLAARSRRSAAQKFRSQLTLKIFSRLISGSPRAAPRLRLSHLIALNRGACSQRSGFACFVRLIRLVQSRSGTFLQTIQEPIIRHLENETKL